VLVITASAVTDVSYITNFCTAFCPVCAISLQVPSYQRFPVTVVSDRQMPYVSAGSIDLFSIIIYANADATSLSSCKITFVSPVSYVTMFSVKFVACNSMNFLFLFIFSFYRECFL
jgi:hypothetical protein